jgi:hypothetical protein
MAAQILERGPKLEDAAVLFLAASWQETPQLAAWSIVWPQLPRNPVPPDSPAAEEILECARQLAEAHAELETAMRLEPNLETHSARERKAARDKHGDGWTLYGDEIERRARAAAADELTYRRDRARTFVELSEGRLRSALKSARSAAR